VRKSNAFKDIREFIARCEELGDAVQVNKEVDWNLKQGQSRAVAVNNPGRPPLSENKRLS